MKKAKVAVIGTGGVGNNTIHLDGLELANSDAYHAYYGYKSEDEDFIRAVLTNGKPLCTVAEAAKSMELVEKIHASFICLSHYNSLRSA